MKTISGRRVIIIDGPRLKLEQAKRKIGIDKTIADKHNLSVKQVEEFFDPRLFAVLSNLLNEKRKVQRT